MLKPKEDLTDIDIFYIKWLNPPSLINRIDVFSSAPHLDNIALIGTSKQKIEIPNGLSDEKPWKNQSFKKVQMLLIWSLESWNCIKRKVLPDNGEIESMKWSPNDQFIAIHYSEGLILILNAIDLEIILELDSARAPTWSPTGKFLMVGGNRVYDGKTMKKITGLDQRNIECDDWSPDERFYIAASKDKTIRVWATATWECVTSFTRDWRSTDKLSWAPTGALVFSLVEEKIIIWDVKSWQEKFTFRSSSGYTTATWSPNSEIIAAGSCDSTITILNANTGKKISETWNSVGRNYTIKWSLHSNLIVSSSEDNNCIILDGRTGIYLTNLDPQKGVWSLFEIEWSKLGEVLMCMNGGRLWIGKVRDSWISS